MTGPESAPTQSQGMPCDLCDIENRYILASSDVARVIASPASVRPGHIVIATRKHVESFAELQAGDLEALMNVLARALKVAEQALPVRRYYVLRIGDKSPHLHFHLIPSFADDEDLGAFIFGERGWAGTLVRSSTESETAAFVQTFKRAFDQK